MPAMTPVIADCKALRIGPRSAPMVIPLQRNVKVRAISEVSNQLELPARCRQMLQERVTEVDTVWSLPLLEPVKELLTALRVIPESFASKTSAERRMRLLKLFVRIPVKQREARDFVNSVRSFSVILQIVSQESSPLIPEE